ncbi:hypothetical protein DYB37_008321 [Aphanomyces astaci]|uniref:Uncharacterized protein n=1 Tax=Aphanomyces astaci TaxID=112090 RepID=A0A418DMT7_APHAT|nr:hypothetical protein DYB35_008896 [Aphanomyces astaci]RHZ16621.1 hypothetical protein DYB37_008321 [Aphanomyces astaci]
MSREARKTAQIWASIEKMQKKEDELSLSDNSSDKTLKQQRKKKKHKQSPSDDDTPSTGPGKVAATNEPTSLGNNESTYHTSMLTLHKSSEFMRSSPFVPPRKKWVSRWETHHHQGPQGSHSEAEVARLGHDEEPLTIAPDNSSSVPTSTTSSATLVVGTDDAMGEVLTSTSPPASSTQHLVSPHHAPSSQLTHPPHLDHHATSAATTVPTIELPAPPLPQESQGILHPPSAVKGTIPNSRPTSQGILPHETEAEEGEYTANSPTNSAVPPQVVVDLGSTDLSPRGPIDSIVAAPSVASSRVQQEEHVPIEGSDGIVPKEISPSAPVVASPVMNALGSRRKRKSLWDVGDPRSERSLFVGLNRRRVTHCPIAFIMLRRLGLVVASAGAMAQARVDWVLARSNHHQHHSSNSNQLLLQDDTYAIGTNGADDDIRPDEYPECEWRVPGSDQNALDIEITKDTVNVDGLDTCFPNVFDHKDSLYFPYPRSSYHYDLEVPPPYDSIKPNPHVHVDVSIDLSDNANVLPAEAKPTIVDFDYKTFESNGPTILYNKLPQTPGVYRLALTAFDFDQAGHGSVQSRKCATCLSVTDTYRPTNTKPSDCSDKPSTAYSAVALERYQNQVNALIQYRVGATNNACSDNRCDEVFVERTAFFETQRTYQFDSQSAVLDPLGHWLTCLSQPLSDAEWAKLTTNPIDEKGDLVVVGGDGPPPSLCTRTCTHSVSLREYYTPYTCDVGVTSPRVCEGTVNSGIDLEKCAFSQTLALDGPTLAPAATVQLKLPASGWTHGEVKLIPNPTAVFPGANYKLPSDNSKELHFDVACERTTAWPQDYDTFCANKFQVNVHDLFTFVGDLSTDAAVQGLFETKSNEILVFWRVKNTFDNKWQRIDDSLELTFPRFETTLVFEGHSACGRVQQVEWTIFVHRTAALVTDAWWRSLWTCGSSKNACTVPQSDFRVCKFRFDPTSDTFKAMLDGPMLVAPPSPQPPPPNPPKLGTITYNVYGKNPSCTGKPDSFMRLNEGVCYKYDDVCAVLDKCQQLKGQYTSVSVQLYRNTKVAVVSLFNAHRCVGKAANTIPRKCNTCATNESEGCSSGITCDFGPPPAPDLPPPPKPIEDALDVKIQWQFGGFHCTWQYDTTESVASSDWLDNTSGTEVIQHDVALTALPGAAWTKLTLTCTLPFSTVTQGIATARTVTRSFGIERCDEPCSADTRRRIQGTCAQLAWFQDAPAKRQPAPYQACAGVTVIPVISAKTFPKYTTAHVLEDELTCCNGKSLECKYACRPFHSNLDLKRCSPLG